MDWRSFNTYNRDRMHWIIVMQIVASVLYVAYLIYQYSLQSVGMFVKISVYLTWLICFGSVVLLPFDIYYSLQSDFAMGIVWKTSYILIFFLTWILLPIAQQYEQAGQFTISGKLKTAIINNLIIYGVFILVGILVLIYIILFHSININQLPPVLLAVSNGFGMFLVVIFLSYGLTSIPRSLWRYKNYKLKLKKLQFNAALLTHKKNKILQELQLKTKQILWEIQKNGENNQTTQIVQLIPNQYLKKWKKNIPNLGQSNVVKVHKQIKQRTLQLSRLQSRWEEVSISAFRIQDILTYINAPNKRIQSTLFDHFNYQLLNNFQWFWHCRIKTYLIPILSILFSIFTITIILAQFTVFIPSIDMVNPFSLLTRINQFICLDLILLFILGYMAFCIYYALFKLKFANYYGLYWNKQTDAASLIFFAINCSRITFPLNYNFLQIIQDNNTSFIQAMGQAPLIGKTLQVVFPVLIIILIIFNAFDVYTKICKKFGFSKFQFQVQFSHQNIQEGRKLLLKARTDLETKILNSNCKNLQQFRSYKLEEPNKEIQINKDSTSSDTLHLKPLFFNQFQNMEQIAKIFQF